MKTTRNNPLDIRHISLKVTELIKQYAVVNNCTQDQMLERIVLEWNSQQSESERPSGDEDE
ncbi:hypothetical protein [Nostoc sp. 'Peltigera membranacea cyanobiont' 232]|jgi:hypothetical protein|uniref:hypothetical protein n=1 Tax=Nostoc sp. 'Peltigera membranacea cyanobiont' 232 TaxID=2014531 RepID=UPI000B950CF7|nr:hypothetical protein [Nostoc sp. 'Peltigera membranacea cyanobiont' 232]OYE02870.1 hypothetical protein CDG79_21715 [Nostoc sp. 'Peltigera membranacea cyanobiont' 232]